jgi:hypothetical protein
VRVDATGRSERWDMLVQALTHETPIGTMTRSPHPA